MTLLQLKGLLIVVMVILLIIGLVSRKPAVRKTMAVLNVLLCICVLAIKA